MIGDMIDFAYTLPFSFMCIAVGSVAEETQGRITLLNVGFTLAHAGANMAIWFGEVVSRQCWSERHTG